MKHTRKPSAFNNFMKQEIERVKKIHPNMKHMEAFKMAASNWKNHSGKAKSLKNMTKKVKKHSKKHNKKHSKKHNKKHSKKHNKKII